MATTQSSAGVRHLPVPALIALCLMAPVSGLAVTGIAPIMPNITAEFADVPQAGLLVRMMMSGLSAATILGALASGVLAGRFGQARLLLYLLALYVVSGAGIYFLDNLYLMVFARCLQGIANGGAGVLAIALITTRVPPERSNHWLGYFSLTGTVGVLFLMMAVGAVAELGWRYVFLLFLLAAPVALMIGLSMRGDGAGETAEAGAGEAGAKAAGIPWLLTIFGTLCGAIMTTITMYLPFHLANIGFGAPETIAMLMVAGAGVGAIPALAFGWLRSRLSALQTFTASLSIIFVAVLVVASARDLPMLYAGMMLHGLGLGALVPNLFAATAAAVPGHLRARTLGFVRAGLYAGPLVAQPGLEAVMQTSGAAASLVAIALASGATLIFALTFRRMFDPPESAAMPA